MSISTQVDDIVGSLLPSKPNQNTSMTLFGGPLKLKTMS
jgi:hypothetical protein